MEAKLEETTLLIQKIIDGQDLTAKETERVLISTSKKDSEGYYFLAFTAGILAKGMTEDELYGLIKGLQKFSIKPKLDIDPKTITDLSGSGGDKLKTFNISTAASFVVAGAGVRVAKQVFKSFTSPLGASDITQELGIELSKTGKEMMSCLKTVGIVPLFYPYLYKGMEARLSAYRKLHKIGLKLPTPMHPIAFVPHPFKLKRRIYGLAWEKYLKPVANIFKRLEYEKVLVFHGLDGLDEISNIGPTKVLELDKGHIKEYLITPKDLGIRKAKYKDIESENKNENIKTWLRILYNKEKGAKRDIVLANAAASLYVMDKAKDLAEGVKMAGEVLDEGLASKKLEQLVKATGNKERLNRWKRKARV